MFEFLKRKKSDEPAIVAEDEFEEDGSVFVGIVKLLLLLFTAYRSVHLITDNLPADAMIVGFAGLGGLDLGLLAWSAAAQHAYGRRFTFAMIGVVIDMAGIAASVVADSSLVAGLNFELVRSVTIWGVGAIVLSNIGLAFAYDLANPARKTRHLARKREARIAAQKQAAEDEIRAADLEVDLAERRAEAQAIKRRASELRRTAVLRLDDVELSENGRRREMAADGTDMPTNRRSKAAPK